MSFLQETESNSNVGFNKRTEHTIWVEKYRPSKLENYIGNDILKNKIKQCISENDIGHLLLFGKAGTGKTSLAKIIVNSINCDYLYINASDENSVDTVRNKIKGFASSVGFKDLKVIILDECLDENTLVTVLRNGEIYKLPIKDLDEKNDLVKSFNVNKNRIEWSTFYLWDKGVQDVVEIEFINNEVVVCTLDHKWYVKDSTGSLIIKKTSELNENDDIFSPNENF